MTPTSSPTIFISIASYLDPMLFFTLNDAMAKASHPERVVFGVADQHPDDQRGAIAALPFSRQVGYAHTYPVDLVGGARAWSLAF